MPGYARFRRTLRIAPGVRLNLSKSGVSTSFGPRGFHYTVGHGRRRTTVGLPGTGLSYTTYSPTHARGAKGTAHSRPVCPTPPRPANPSASSAKSGVQQLANLAPPQKIAWGIVLTLLVITSPIGLWLLVAGLWQLHVPEWRIRSYVHQAALEPANARDLLLQAAAIDARSPEVLAPLAEVTAAHGDNAAALRLYREYCAKVPSDWLARGHLAMTALKCNQVDEAIAELVAIRQAAPATDDSMASVTAHLAYAYLCKEDPRQGLSFATSAPGRTGTLGPGSEQCVFYGGVCKYMLGRTDAALGDLATLYAINPAFDGLQAVRDAMTAGTYELLLPDGSALVPRRPGHAIRSAIVVQRQPPLSAHCLNCQAPLRAGAPECSYCHAAVSTRSPLPAASPPPPPPPPPAM
ncbi:MAG: DUF4236 domain-containing protein [Candidatus Dormibacteraeota bacterium]|uniref:DUF4236 domain-containing protein n=1 Tax=Candidatus Amunia macphersoniae TaxID=3127014 RepID=A0A934KPU5_9BACT|nr:DUF4236 domain-containing protein [Candidatus Dormibacteraeota bacterium]